MVFVLFYDVNTKNVGVLDVEFLMMSKPIIPMKNSEVGCLPDPENRMGRSYHEVGGGAQPRATTD